MNTEDLSALWSRGWQDALSHVKEKLISVQMDSLDQETQSKITVIFNYVKELEKSHPEVIQAPVSQ